MAADSIPPEELQKLAYETLSSYFYEHQDEVIEIEILPPAIEPPDGIIMQDGLSIGIPKKILVLAFLEARKRFFEDMHNVEDTAAALQATNVMLLFDPEHITAANYRKRRLDMLKGSAPTETGSAYHRALRQELCFLNTILTSPLHRQSKSPTLWHQRFCILDPLMRIELNGATEEDRTAFWLAELTAVCRSGEQHPKNYYAWQYARRLLSRIGSHDVRGDIGHFVKDWCFKHPSDISGWSFLLHVISAIWPVARHSLLRNVLSYAIDLKAEQESLWVFIRVALAHESFSGPRTELYQTLQYYSKGLTMDEKDSALTNRVSSALRWIDEHQHLDTISASRRSTLSTG